MPWVKQSLPRRVWSSLVDVPRRWWKEATKPFGHSGLSWRLELFRRLLLWMPVVVLGAITIGVLGLYFFTGWRAWDLTAKALDNAERGNARFARLQISSAASLRPKDPEVQRAKALIESRLGNPAAVQMWEDLRSNTPLSRDEIEVRAEIMTFHGDDTQFAAAVEALEQSGVTDRAAALRAQRSLQRGNLEKALALARAAVSAGDEPSLRLKLLRLLAMRHGRFLETPSRGGASDLAAAAEMTNLIDSLIDTPVGDEALALGLSEPYFTDTKKSAWAAAAWRNGHASNPALLPAAEFLANSGEEAPEQLRNRLNVIFLHAALPEQAAFARWMLRRGMHEEVLVTASASEAAQDEGIFTARAAALASLSRWEELHRLADAPSQASQTIRLLAKARAARELGRGGEEAQLTRTALRGALREGRLLQAIQIADEQGQRAQADQVLVELSGQPMVADPVFRVARDRFERRGQFATLDQAYAAAQRAAPTATSVRDYGLYRDLLTGAGVDPEVTAEALTATPTEMSAHFNHALALLRAGRAQEALAVFDDYDVFVDQLPPGLRAVSAALIGASGDELSARSLVRGIDPHLLTPGEYALIAPLRNVVEEEGR